jgi:hypothetical protein
MGDNKIGFTNKSEDFKPENTNEKFISKEIDILEKNKKFFSADRKYIKIMLEIINGESQISIRVLDWFVTNYSKKYNTAYKIKINGREDYFYVNTEYKNQLNSYSKLYFDPFCRKKKVIYCYRSNTNTNTNKEDDINFLSSIGQLNFFQWAVRNKVIHYVQLHLDEIIHDMKETTKLNKEKKLSAQQDDDDEPIEEESDDDEPDPVICSSDKINSVKISPAKKKSSSNKSSSDKNKRQQLSHSVYDHGIKKSTVPIRLDFD